MIRSCCAMFYGTTVRTLIKSPLRNKVHTTILIQHLLRPLHTTSSVKDESKISLLEAIYTDEQRQQILHTLNTASKETLSLRKIPPARQRQIFEHKPFKHLADIFKIEKMDIVKAERLYRALLREVTERSSSKKATSISPKLDAATAASINTITAIDIGTEFSYYVTMDSDYTIHDVAQIDMKGENRTGPSIYHYNQQAYISAVRNFLKSVPVSDAYLLHAKRKATNENDAKRLTIHFGNKLLQAIFASIVETRNDDKQLVYVLLESNVVYHSGLKVGSERVSSSSRVVDILDSQNYKGAHIKNTDIFKIKMANIYREEQKDRANFLLLSNLHFVTNILHPAKSRMMHDSLPLESEELLSEDVNKEEETQYS